MLRFAAVWTLAVTGLLATCNVADAAPSAVIDRTQLLPRADLSAAAWSKTADTYRHDYVYPSTRPVRLNGCSSRNDATAPASGVPNLVWTLAPLEGQPGATAIQVRGGPAQCEMRADVPAMGRWRVALAATDPGGATANATTDVSFRDILVAAVGDSFASGEGNKVKAAGDVKGWIDPQCHRSYNAWPAFLARSLENDSTAVTFLSFACSGADIQNLIDTRYEGIVGSSPKVPPQLPALRALLGDPVAPGTRPVDALVGAIGINTLGVTQNLLACLGDVVHGIDILGECRKDYTNEFAHLPARLDAIELALSANLRLAQFHLIGYPSRIMTDRFDKYPLKITGVRCNVTPGCVANAALCGVFANLRVADKQWMTTSLEGVNRLLGKAAQRHNWTVTPTIDAFRRHGYCTPSGRTWFRSFFSSLALQHDIYGTVHPTRKGHVAAFEAVAPHVRLDSAAPAPDRFAIDLTRVKLALPDQQLELPERPHQVGETQVRIAGAAHVACGPVAAQPSLLAYPFPAATVSAGPCRHFTITTAGSTIAIKASATVSRFVPRRPPIPGEPGAGSSRSATLDAQRFHVRADNWDAAPVTIGPFPAEPPRHRLVAGSSHGRFGKLVIEYTITKPTVAPAPAALRGSQQASPSPGPSAPKAQRSLIEVP